jgi:biopolymer transport protein ExbD
LANWDVFHADSLELERGLSSDTVRTALAGGILRDDDLVRPAGTAAAWTRLGDLPELTAPGVAEPPKAAAAPTAPTPPPREAAPAQRESATPPRDTPSPKREAAPIQREPAPRVDRPPATVEPAERIRAGRIEVPPARAVQSDFEIQAEDLGPIPQADVPTASTTTAPPPAWLELGGEPDDVTFPAIPGRPEDWLSEPPLPPSGRESERPKLSAWAWPDDDDDDDAAGDELKPGVAEFDDQIEILDDDADGLEILDEDGLSVPSPLSREATSGNGASRVALPVVPSRDWNEDRAPVEDGDEGDFTLSRSGPMTVEELDLAPMVDVAFQLVLFFMVTATTVLYKTLEIPKPTTDQAPNAVSQGTSRSVDDLQKDYILVEIDSGGTIKIDREPVAASVDAIAERLRTARDKTGRKIMLLSADYTTPHRNAVLAYDSAIEIGMGIAIARPTPPQGPAPSVFPASGRGSASNPTAVGTSPPATTPATAPAPPKAAPPAPPPPAPGSPPF